MAVPIEKSTIGIVGGESPRNTTSSTIAVNDADENDRATQEKSIHDTTDDQYSHGLKLVLLAGASMVAVFLIALDQVGNTPPLSILLTQRTDHCRYSNSENHG